MINIMSTDKGLHVGEILAQSPNGSIICTRGIKGYCRCTCSFSTNFVKDLVIQYKASQIMNLHVSIFSYSLPHLSTASISKIHRKVQGTTNCHSITEDNREPS